MSAGGSDYGGVVQGNLGQGFAQGAQQGIENYNKGVDRKAAQANTYLTQFIGPNLQRLSKAEPRPPAGSPPQDFQEWAQREIARQTQMKTLLTQSDKYLKQTGSPVGAEEWAGLWYDPSTAMSPEDSANLAKNAGKYAALTQQLESLRADIIKTDPASETYKVKVDAYNKLIKDNDYGGIYKAITGVEYTELVGTEAEGKARLQDKVITSDLNYLTSLAQTIKDPAGIQLINEIISSGRRLTPEDRKKLNALVDGEGLDNLIKSGSEAGFGSAIQRIDNMTDEERANLSPTAKSFWQQVQAFRTDPASVTTVGPLKAALQKYVLVDQSTVQGQNTITLQGVQIKYQEQSLVLAKQTEVINNLTIDNTKKEQLYKIGALALEGNGMVFAAKNDFMDQLGDEMPQAEKDALWDKAVVQPFQAYAAKQAKNIEVLDGQLLGMKLNQSAVLDDSIAKGRFHLSSMFVKDANGNPTIDKTSEIYKRVMEVQGNPSDATIMAWYNDSQTTFNQLDTKTRQDLEIGAATVKSKNAQAISDTVAAEYADIFAQQKVTGGNLANESAQLTVNEQNARAPYNGRRAQAEVLTAEGNANVAQAEGNHAEETVTVKLAGAKKDNTLKDYAIDQAKLDATVAKAKANGQVAIMMGQVVAQVGPGILKDPAFKASMMTAFPSEGAYNAAVEYVTRQAGYEEALKKGELTIQGQRITAADADMFDRMFTSPAAIRAASMDPQRVERIARAAGVNPTAAMSALTQLANENRSLTALQARSIRFDMYARERTMDTNDAQYATDNAFRVSRAARSDYEYNHTYAFQSGRAQRSDYESDRNYNRGVFVSDRDYNRGVVVSDRGFNRGIYQDERDYAASQRQQSWDNNFRQNGLNLEYARFDDQRTFRDKEYNNSVLKDARDFAYKQQQDGIANAASTRQFQAMFLQPLGQKVDIVQGQLSDAKGELNKFIESNVAKNFINGNIVWKQVTDSNGGVILKAVPKDNASKAQFNELVKDGTIAQLTSLKNVTYNLGQELESGKALYGSLIDQGIKSFGAAAADVPTSTTPLSQLSAKPGQISVTTFKNYLKSASTNIGVAGAKYVTDVLNGNVGPGYAGIYDPKHCTTFVQGFAAATMNIPGGIPTGGSEGANGFMNGLLSKGATLVPGHGANGSLSVDDIKKLPDGTMLFQKDGTVMGHTAIILGGVIVQNSGYSDQKLRGAIGVMDSKAFVTARGTQTYAVQVPNSWYKQGLAPNPNAVSVATPGGKPATTTAPAKPAPTPAKTTPSKFDDGSGNFQPSLQGVSKYISGKIPGGQGVRITASPGGNSGLSFKTGNNRYAVITNDTVALTAVSHVATQFGVHFQSSQGAPLKDAYKQNPQKVRNALIVELKDAGFTGDLNKYVTMWFARKGWGK